MKATIKMYSYEDGVTETKVIEADDMDSIRFQADEATEAWMQGGEWGDDGALVSAQWSIIALSEIDENADLSGDLYNNVEIEIEPNHAGKIKEAMSGTDSCGDDPDDHDWTADGEGGLKENPGVRGKGGTIMTFDSHCRRCGLHRHTHCVGSQGESQGQHDTVTYEMLDDEVIAKHRENGDMDEKKGDS